MTRDELRKLAEDIIACSDGSDAAIADAFLEADAERERLEVQLAGCGVAAMGWSTGENAAKEGDYGWSVSYSEVLRLRGAMESLRAELEKRTAERDSLEFVLKETQVECARLQKIEAERDKAQRSLEVIKEENRILRAEVDDDSVPIIHGRSELAAHDERVTEPLRAALEKRTAERDAAIDVGDGYHREIVELRRERDEARAEVAQLAKGQEMLQECGREIDADRDRLRRQVEEVTAECARLREDAEKYRGLCK